MVVCDLLGRQRGERLDLHDVTSHDHAHQLRRDELDTDLARARGDCQRAERLPRRQLPAGTSVPDSPRCRRATTVAWQSIPLPFLNPISAATPTVAATRVPRPAFPARAPALSWGRSEVGSRRRTAAVWCRSSGAPARSPLRLLRPRRVSTSGQFHCAQTTFEHWPGSDPGCRNSRPAARAAFARCWWMSR